MPAQPGPTECLVAMPAAAPPSGSHVDTAPTHQPSVSSAAFLAEASGQLADSRDPQVAARTLANVSVPRLGEGCIVCVLDDAENVAFVATKHHDPRLQEILTDLESHPAMHNWQPIVSVAHSQETTVLSRLTTTLLLADGNTPRTIARDLGFKAAVVVPAKGSRRTLGVLVLLSRRARFYNSGRLALADELASRFAHVVESAPAALPQPAGDVVGAEALATAVHDLLTPLTYIKTSAQLLRRLEERTDATTRAELRRRLEGIDSATVRITSELRGLLQMIRPCAQQPPGTDIPWVDVVALVRRVVAEQVAIDDEHEIGIGEAPQQLSGPWNADELERMLTNLIGNAVKYSPAHTGVDVRVTVEEDADGRWAVLRVADRGLGIPARDLPFVFEPFQRGSNVGTIAGTGLGLASVWQAVKLHAGRLWIESEEGQGTRVTVRLPLPLTPAPTSTHD
jgi:signal transduction histidine kinase